MGAAMSRAEAACNERARAQMPTAAPSLTAAAGPSAAEHAPVKRSAVVTERTDAARAAVRQKTARSLVQRAGKSPTAARRSSSAAIVNLLKAAVGAPLQINVVARRPRATRVAPSAERFQMAAAPRFRAERAPTG